MCLRLIFRYLLVLCLTASLTAPPPPPPPYSHPSSSMGRLLGLAEIGAHSKHQQRHRDRYLELSFAQFRCIVVEDVLRRQEVCKR